MSGLAPAVLDRHDYRAEIERIAAGLPAPVLHIGARMQVIDRPAAARRTWRERIGGRGYVAADLEPGENVDAVFDIAWPMERIRDALAPWPGEFGSVLVPHVLEHVRDPFAAARNIAALVRPGGRVFVQVPWVQAYHPFPDDYWRISPRGLAVLFEGFETLDHFYSGGSSDVAFRVRRDGRPALDREALGAEADLFQVLLDPKENLDFLAKAGKRVSLSRGYMPVTVVNFLAAKPADPA